MADADDDPPGFDPPELDCRHSLLCRTYWQEPDPAEPDGFAYYVGRPLIGIRAPAGRGFPFHVDLMFLCAQLAGTPGEYLAQVQLHRVEAGEDGAETAVFVTEFGPWPPLVVTGEWPADPFGIPLRGVPFDEPGVYEFQLWVDGFDGPLAAERVEVRE